MEEHVRQAVVGNDEAEALGDVEPLDPAADLNELERTVSADVLRRLATGVERLRLPLGSRMRLEP